MFNFVTDTFGDRIMRQGFKNTTRQPITNNENVGKVLNAPTKSNEPLKKGDTKKSFLANTGKALQATPTPTGLRQVFTPRPLNVGALIYNDPGVIDNEINMEELEFSKPSLKYDNFFIYDYLPLPVPEITQQTPPTTPPPLVKNSICMKFNDSYEDDFYQDDFFNDCIQENDFTLDLPEPYY